ncbi:MAG: internal scaffolding protein [Arizlama microvirus]|nr:MAG: internal scaffolding protein [Arizlama microvirus]
MVTIARAQYDVRNAFASDLSFEGDKGVTKQSDLKESDINTIFRKFEKTGLLPQMIVKEGRYGDFSAVPDYQEALQIIKTADEQFINLDVDIRNRFANDPAKFLEFATDLKNLDEMEKMGLLKPEIVKQRADARLAARLAEKQAEAVKPVA